MIAWPQHLVDDLARRRAVAFLGAGVSRNASGTGGKKPPSWEEFLEHGLKSCSKPVQHIKKLLKQQDYLTACELIKSKLDEEFGALLTREFVEPEYQPADIHHHIFALDLRIVATQNFDKIYDTFAAHESAGTVQVKSYYDADIAAVARDSLRYVVKVHGTIDQPAKMIFTRKEYTDARYRYGTFYAVMDALSVTHTFVFLGCSLSDPDMRLMLERHAQFYPHARPHYLIAPEGSIHAAVVDSTRANLNLKVLTYEAEGGHAELTDSLKALAVLVEARRGELAANHEW